MEKEMMKVAIPPDEGGTTVKREIEVESGTLLIVYCDDCQKLLYATTELNFVTNHIAREITSSHSLAFQDPHTIHLITPQVSRD